MKTLSKALRPFLMSAVLLVSGLSHAETLVCQGQVNFYGTMQKFTVTIEGQDIGQAYHPSVVNKIVVSGASLESPNVFADAKDYWDGHSSGMITAQGFSMAYDNLFGQIRNVVVTTDFRGDVRKMGSTIGHVTQSEVIASCATRAILHGNPENLR